MSSLGKRQATSDPGAPDSKRAKTLRDNLRKMFFDYLTKAAAYKSVGDYEAFVERHGKQLLFDCLIECSDPLAIDLVELGDVRNRDRLNELPGVNGYHKPGWYLGILNDRVVVEEYWLYAGQSVKVHHRGQQHEGDSLDPKRSEGGLLYPIWRKKGTDRYITWKLLGKWNHPSVAFSERDLELWYNLIEMWWSVSIQTIPSALDRFLPAGMVKEAYDRGLNIQICLAQGSIKGMKAGTLIHSNNPEIAETYRAQCVKRGEHMQEVHRADDYKTLTDAQRRRFGNADKRRSGRGAEHNEPTTVMLRCKYCVNRGEPEPFEFLYEQPEWIVDNDKLYLPAKKRCTKCPVPAKKGKNGKESNSKPATLFVPVDPNIQYTCHMPRSIK